MYFLDKSFNWSLKIIIMKVLKLLDIGLQVYIVKFLNKTEKKKIGERKSVTNLILM